MKLTRTQLVAVPALALSLLGGAAVTATAAEAAPPKKPAATKPTPKPKAPVPRVGGAPAGCTLKARKPERIGATSDARMILEAYCKESSKARPVGLDFDAARCRLPLLGAGACPSWIKESHDVRFVDLGHDYALDAEMTFGLMPAAPFAVKGHGSVTWRVPALKKGDPTRIKTAFQNSAVLRGAEHSGITGRG